MSVKYHVNTHTGMIGKCKAQQNCPFGDLVTEHYATMKEARAAFEDRMMAQSVTPGVVRDSLKEMGANDLAHEIMQRVDEAGLKKEEYSDILELTSILHAEQRRRTRVPGKEALYIEHPLRVSLRLMRQGVKDEAVLKATLLHDAVEDGSVTFAKDFLGRNDVSETEARDLLLAHIASSYGDDVKETVKAVTNPLLSNKEKHRRTVEEKNRNYYEHVVEEVTSSQRALLVKLSDFMDNAGSLHHTDFAGTEVKTKHQAVKYRPVADVFLQELEKDNPYLTPEARQHFTAKVKAAVARMDTIIEKYKDLH